MKFSRFFAFLTVVATALGAFADANNMLVNFSTIGPDCYADGKTAVKDGEWYALVWTKNDTFGGLDANLRPLVDGDLLLLAAPLAEKGRCPYVVFQLTTEETKDIKGGKYLVILLDTRGADGNPSARGADGKPSVLNGVLAMSDGDAAGYKSEGSWLESPANVPPPVVVGIVVGESKVEISASNLYPNVRYNVTAGAVPQKLLSEPVALPRTGTSDPNDKVVFVLNRPAGSGEQFYRVIRQPLAAPSAELPMPVSRAE